MTLDNVVLARPVTVFAGATSIRVAGLTHEGGVVEACIQTEENGFTEPSARATFSRTDMPAVNGSESSRTAPDFSAQTLYGPLFFQAGRFHRLSAFELATSRYVRARLSPAPCVSWFGAYESPELILVDPGARDAAMHALQVAIPHKLVVPTSVERITVGNRGVAARVCASEKDATGGTYTFDIEIQDHCGRVIEFWRNATFRAIGEIDIASVLAAESAMAVPYVERLAREILNDDSIEVAIAFDADRDRQEARRAAVRMLGIEEDRKARGDGRPMTKQRPALSLSHCGGICIAVTSQFSVGCDIEDVGRFADAPGNAVNSSERNPSKSLSLTRDWCVKEVARKLGRFGLAATVKSRESPGGVVCYAGPEGLNVVTVPIPVGTKNIIVAIGASSRPANQLA
jgi:enediyne polyketide synthase